MDHVVPQAGVLYGHGPLESRPPLRTDAAGERLRLLHVHAHPDDESSKGAATTAKYVAEGVEVIVATCTGGERGSILNPAMERADVLERISEIRRAEMEKARDILGIEQEWLGFTDSGLPEGDPLPPLPEGCFGLMDPAEAAVPLIKLIREFRPHVLTTYDENGGYPHPDHIMCHKISMVAFEAAADPTAHPELGEPWQVLKLYYQFGFHPEKFKALDAGLVAAGRDPVFAERFKDWKPDPTVAERITTRVPCGDYFDVRDQALIAHETQVDPTGFWFQVPLEIQQEVWPTEEWQLVTSKVETQLPEDDLFAGIAVRGSAEPVRGEVAVGSALGAQA